MLRQFHVGIDTNEDGWFVVTCLELPGCVSQGRTYIEAIRKINDAIVVSLETRRAERLPLHLPSEVQEIKVEVPV